VHSGVRGQSDADQHVEAHRDRLLLDTVYGARSRRTAIDLRAALDRGAQLVEEPQTGRDQSAAPERCTLARSQHGCDEHQQHELERESGPTTENSSAIPAKAPKGQDHAHAGMTSKYPCAG